MARLEEAERNDTEAARDAKLTQIGWFPKMIKLDWFGGHNSSASTSFSARVLAPMLMDGTG